MPNIIATGPVITGPANIYPVAEPPDISPAAAAVAADLRLGTCILCGQPLLLNFTRIALIADRRHRFVARAHRSCYGAWMQSRT